MPQVIELDLDAHKLIEAERRSLDESRLAIIKRVFRERQSGLAVRDRPAGRQRRVSTPAARETGKFLVRLGDRQMVTGSQKAAYIQLLLWLNEAHPGLFESLADRPSRRGRRTVARSAAALYPRPDLQVYGEEIAEGWYADLNLSKDQKIQRLRQACAEAGLAYGADADADAGL